MPADRQPALHTVAPRSAHYQARPPRPAASPKSLFLRAAVRSSKGSRGGRLARLRHANQRAGQYTTLPDSTMSVTRAVIVDGLRHSPASFAAGGMWGAPLGRPPQLFGVGRRACLTRAPGTACLDGPVRGLGAGLGSADSRARMRAGGWRRPDASARPQRRIRRLARLSHRYAGCAAQRATRPPHKPSRSVAAARFQAVIRPRVARATGCARPGLGRCRSDQLAAVRSNCSAGFRYVAVPGRALSAG